jgi:NAD(P)-dependent dehydrogenase (short-subunit alcohol dehydrogenase family)
LDRLLEGKSALVTGAGQGIGRAVAMAFAEHGCKVVVNDIVGAHADAVVAKIGEGNGGAVASHHDISTMDGAKAAVECAVESFGKLNILVNNAGVLRDRMSFNMSEEEWDAVINVCLKGTFACTRHALSHMRSRGEGGRIINVTSRTGLRGTVGQANYAAAKAGVLGFTRTVCQEVAKYGITVNAISPRAVTAMTDSVPDEVKKKKDASWAGTQVRKRGQPEEVAPLTVYLASDEADWINGQVIGLGGDKLSLWSHPKEVTEAFIFGGWSVQNIRDLFKSSVGFELQGVGNKD